MIYLKANYVYENLQSANENETSWQIENLRCPQCRRPECSDRGNHNGSTGYYCAGMNKHATIKVNGSVGRVSQKI